MRNIILTLILFPLGALGAGLRGQASIIPSPSSTCRWAFGAKFTQGTDLTDIVDAFDKLVKSCPQYQTAGVGTASPGSSSNYDLLTYVDSADCDTTFEQAGCMVSVLGTDTDLAARLTSNLVDVAEISIANITATGSLQEGDIVESHFVRFRDASQREYLSQRATVFLEEAPRVAAFNVSDVQSGATAFPEDYLKMWPNDVHFAAMLNFGKQDMMHGQNNLASFSRYIINNPYEIGNSFLPGQTANVLETSSIVVSVEHIIN